jgi:hypothetical protein
MEHSCGMQTLPSQLWYSSNQQRGIMVAYGKELKEEERVHTLKETTLEHI